MIAMMPATYPTTMLVQEAVDRAKELAESIEELYWKIETDAAFGESYCVYTYQFNRTNGDQKMSVYSARYVLTLN